MAKLLRNPTIYQLKKSLIAGSSWIVTSEYQSWAFSLVKRSKLKVTTPYAGSKHITSTKLIQYVCILPAETDVEPEYTLIVPTESTLKQITKNQFLALQKLFGPDAEHYSGSNYN